MTVNAELPRVQHVTDGIQVNFPFIFRVLEEDDIEVFLNGNTLPESPVDFTVTLTPGPPVGNDGGNVLWTGLPIPGPGSLTIVRITDRTQDTDYVAFDAFPAETHETGLDKAMMVAQEYADTLNRVFLAAPGYDPTTLLLVPDYLSGRFLQWSVDPDDGLPHRLINSAVDASGLQALVDTAVAAALAAAASAAAALASELAAAASAAAAGVSETNAAASAAAAAADAIAAAASAAAALASEGAAAASAAAASVSAGNAATSETNAGISAAAALVSEGNAAASAAAALVSEGNAAGSAAAALVSEGNAATSETNAATSETNAALSAAAAAASAAVAAFFDVSTYQEAPVATGIVRHIMSRSATYDFDGIAGTGFASTAPTASTVFTVNKELLAGGTTALGTMTFPLGVNDGVWADVAGGDVTFAAGDRIEIVSPGAVNGIAEMAITVPLLLP
jgi:hypothetical protein